MLFIENRFKNARFPKSRLGIKEKIFNIFVGITGIFTFEILFQKRRSIRFSNGENVYNICLNLERVTKC